MSTRSTYATPGSENSVVRVNLDKERYNSPAPRDRKAVHDYIQRYNPLSWQLEKEIDGTFLYKALATSEQQPQIAEVYRWLSASRDVYASGRKLKNEMLVIALNTDDQVKSLDIAVKDPGLPNGTLTAIFGKARVKVRGGKILDLKLAPRSGMALKGKR